MKGVSFVNPIRFRDSSSTIPSPSIFSSHLRPVHRHNRSFSGLIHRKCRHFTATVSFFSAKASLSSDSLGYGGWDEFELAGDRQKLGESSQLRNFLVSVGIDDKTHVFIFLLGLICALAVSRVRVSNIIVFPAAVLVFAVGFSFGFVRGGSFTDGSSKKKEELARVYRDRLKTLVGFLDDFDVKFGLLKNNIQRAIRSRNFTKDELESYLDVVESVKLAGCNARGFLEVSLDSSGNSNRETQKQPTRRRKDNAEGGSELFQYLGSLFGKKIVSSKATQANDASKREGLATESRTQTQTQSEISRPTAEDRHYASANRSEWNEDLDLTQDALRDNFVLNRDGYKNPDMDLETRKVEWAVDTLGRSAKRYANRYDKISQKNILQPTHKDSDNGGENERWESKSKMGDPLDLHMETEASFTHEQIFRTSSVSYRSLHNEANIQREPCEERIDFRTDSPVYGNPSPLESEFGSSASSKFVEDLKFDKYLTEANALLKESKRCLKGTRDEERAEIVLDKCALLLSKAISVKPMSLLAVGQLGNTYLLHGELKLNISRELRSLLSSNNFLGIEGQEKVFRGSVTSSLCKDDVASALVNVCEECEELLVNAGRKYRLALSIDGNDVRSLYNWGLALSFRAQLIADIGPEAALDADKLFLAAIDKFDAMMSKTNEYAPDALLRWGAALQQRSRLRLHHKEKAKLLHQARRLYEDALHMDAENIQVRDALSSCVSELSYRYF